MTNSWSLLAHHLEGTMDEVFPIKTKFKYNEDEILDAEEMEKNFKLP